MVITFQLLSKQIKVKGIHYSVSKLLVEALEMLKKYVGPKEDDLDLEFELQIELKKV